MQWKKILPFLLIIILISYCGTIPEIHYYLIDYSLEPVNIENAKHQIILGIEKIDSEPQYSGEQIVYRDSPYEIKFYNYHRWITSPKKIVTEKVIEQFASSKLFKHVVQFPQVSKIDYLLRGTIKAFEEWDEGDEWYAHVQLYFELIAVKEGTICWQGTVTKKTKVARKKPIEMVRSIGVSLRACIKEAIERVDQKLSQLSESGSL